MDKKVLTVSDLTALMRGFGPVQELGRILCVKGATFEDLVDFLKKGGLEVQMSSDSRLWPLGVSVEQLRDDEYHEIRAQDFVFDGGSLVRYGSAVLKYLEKLSYEMFHGTSPLTGRPKGIFSTDN